MVLLCFVLDLRSLSPSLLNNLKESLIQLANFYAISSPSRCSQSDSLSDRIGLCYVSKNRISCSDELKICYAPRKDFSLRDFHHAVNNLPIDKFLPEINDSGAICCRGFLLYLPVWALYSWGGKDIVRKLILLTSCLPENVDSALKKTLMDAADECVSVEFVFVEQKSSHLSDMQEKINSFLRNISDLDNCSLQKYLPDEKVFHGLVRRWLQDLRDDMDEVLQVRFKFETNLVGSVDQISCNLCASTSRIIDSFSPCKTCRCHGLPLGDEVKNRTKGSSCSVTGHDLGNFDVIETSLKVGERTVLFVPSSRSSVKLQVSSPIDFNVIERTNLGSLSEGVLMGASYFVTPSACHEMEAASDETDQSEFNAQLFQGLCSSLHSSDQGLICSSNCNIETMIEAAFHCYYILQPSDNGPMLLRRLAGSEEALPVSDINRLGESSVPIEIAASIQKFLSKMESRDYNPLLHERGFHEKLNLLVKDSLPFGSVPLGEASELNPTLPDSLEVTTQSNPGTVIVVEEETPHPTAGEDKISACIFEEWEQLVVTEVPKKYSPSCVSKPKLDQSIQSPDSNKQMDIKTSRILERLEVPRQLKTKVTSPTITSSTNSGGSVATKKPLILFPPNIGEQGSTSDALMKPNFQRLKRKFK